MNHNFWFIYYTDTITTKYGFKIGFQLQLKYSFLFITLKYRTLLIDTRRTHLFSNGYIFFGCRSIVIVYTQHVPPINSHAKKLCADFNWLIPNQTVKNQHESLLVYTHRLTWARNRVEMTLKEPEQVQNVQRKELATKWTSVLWLGLSETFNLPISTTKGLTITNRGDTNLSTKKTPLSLSPRLWSSRTINNMKTYYASRFFIESSIIVYYAWMALARSIWIFCGISMQLK